MDYQGDYYGFYTGLKWILRVTIMDFRGRKLRIALAGFWVVGSFEVIFNRGFGEGNYEMRARFPRGTWEQMLFI